MPRIRDALLDCVVYLYPSRKDAEEGARYGGSGFLVGIPSKGLPQNFWFLQVVTNKHIVQDGNTVLRMTTKEGNIDILETDERSWSCHQRGADVATCLISFDPEAFRFNFVPRDAFLAVLIPPVVDLTLAGVAQRVEHA